MEKKEEEISQDNNIIVEKINNKIKKFKMLEEEFKRIKNPLRLYRRLMIKQRKLIPIKEPLLIFETGNKLKTFEGIRTGRWAFRHSNGELRTLLISSKFYKNWDYLGHNIKVMFATENGALPFTDDPLIASDEFEKYDTKIRYDNANYRAQEIREKGKMYYNIGIGIAIALGVVGLSIYLYQSSKNGNIQPVQQVIQQTPIIMQNITATVI